MFWCASALAGAVEADPEHARGSVGAGLGTWVELQPDDLVPAPAAVARGGIALADPLWIELEGDLGLPPGGVAWASRLQLGVLVPSPLLRPELLAGVGLQAASSRDPAIATEPALLAHWGMALGVPLGGGPNVIRVDARHVLEPLDGAAPSHHFVGTLGVERLLGPRSREPRAAEAEVPPASFTISPASAQVWIAHPVCAWVPASEAVPIIRSRATGPVTVVAPGYLPVTVDPATVGEIVLQRAPAIGSLVVAAAPGDQVRVDGLAVATDADGVVVKDVREGTVVVQVVGGGRSFREELAAAEGYGLWVRVPPPPVWEVRFAANSAAISAEGRARLGQLVEEAGDAVFRLTGSHSEEGTAKANIELADRRARAVRDALVAAGMPADRLVVTPSRELDRPAPEDQRAVLIQAVGR